MSEEVKFTKYEMRILELTKDSPEQLQSPEAKALRKILDTYPWMLSIAEYKFDTKIAKAAVNLFGAQVSLQEEIDQYELAAKLKLREEEVLRNSASNPPKQLSEEVK